MSFYWRPYVPVAQKRANAMRKIEKMRKKGVTIQPIEIEGRSIAKSFWGKTWCDHLESFSDYENRLPRGRTYVRNGSVCHLEIKKGQIEAMVSGSELYHVSIGIKPLQNSRWKAIKRQCSGKIGSMLELLKGRLSDQVMSIVTDRAKGLMPLPGEIKLNCSCPDWADMCKHVAAVLYGVGSRLDTIPELLFTLRGVDAGELISTDIVLPMSNAALAGKTIAADQISDIFGIDMANNGDADPKQIMPGETGISLRRKSIDIKTTSGKKIAPSAKKEFNVKTITSIHKPSPIADKPQMRFTGKLVTTLRQRLKLTVPQFAKRVAVSPAIVYRWGKTPGDLKLQNRTMRKLAELHRQLMPPK
jgi:uncharacterized Zn finger protein